MRKAMAERFGMTDFVNPAEVEGDLVPYLVDLTDGGADYSFECIGNVNTISFGGQEFWLDDIQNTEDECDWGYEDLSPSLAMGPGSSFMTNGLPSKTRDFILWNGTPFTTGNVQVSLANQACNTGKELEL